MKIKEKKIKIMNPIVSLCTRTVSLRMIHTVYRIAPNRNILCNHNGHTQRFVLLPISISVHDKYNLYQNLYHAFVCNANNTNFRSPIFSIWQSNWRQQFSLQYSNRTIHDWWPFDEKTDRKCNVIFDDEF